MYFVDIVVDIVVVIVVDIIADRVVVDLIVGTDVDVVADVIDILLTLLLFLTAGLHGPSIVTARHKNIDILSSSSNASRSDSAISRGKSI